MAVDPVCGMTVNPDRAAGTVVNDGTTYYFCAESCLERFKDDPASFLTSERPEAAPPVAPEGAVVEYTCPMDPEIVRPALRKT